MLNKSRDRETNTSSFSLLFSSFDALNVKNKKKKKNLLMMHPVVRSVGRSVVDSGGEREPTTIREE